MNLFISKAYAQVTEAATDVAVPASADPNATVLPADAPSATEAFMTQMGMIVLMVALFYMLLIRPQQKRFKEHSEMLRGLKKGDKVVTGGGLVGTIEKMSDGSDEVIVDLGGGMKVTALRGTLQLKNTPLLKDAPANDQKTTKVKG